MSKVSRKELLNEPDEFITATTGLLNLIKNNLKSFFILLTAVIILVAAGGGFYYWKVNRDAAAMNDYFSAGNDMSKLKQVAEKYNNTNAGLFARLKLSSINFDNKDYSKALDDAKIFETDWSKKDILFFKAAINMAATQMELKQWDKAIPLLDKCIASAPENIKGEAAFFKAACLNAVGKKAEAAELLKTVTGKYLDMAQTAIPDIK